jgi:hypothetical protein
MAAFRFAPTHQVFAAQWQQPVGINREPPQCVALELVYYNVAFPFFVHNEWIAPAGMLLSRLLYTFTLVTSDA